MSDAAAFSATYADWRLVKTRSVVQIVFEAPIEREAEVYAVLGGMPRAAEERWFAIARLTSGEQGEARFSRPTTADGSTLQRVEGAAPGEVTAPARSLSQIIYKRVCMQPKGRKFIEEFFQDILRGETVNDAEKAKDMIRRRLGIGSLSEVDTDPVASEQAEQLLNWFAGWERGYVGQT